MCRFGNVYSSEYASEVEEPLASLVPVMGWLIQTTHMSSVYVALSSV
jgi:hypothetical protein